MKTCLLLLALTLVACGPASPAPDSGTGGGAGGGDAGYPGPYGVGLGDVISGVTLSGFPNGTVDSTTLANISLSDFYNPTGTDTYPTGSPYGAGNPKPLALLIDRGAIWCGPCNEEAKTDLPAKHTQYYPHGEFYLSLDEGATPGVAPTQANLKSWVTAYAVNYPGVLDPDYAFAPIVGADAYPANIIIRTKDMKIIKWVSGKPDDAFWQTFEDVIAGTANP